MINNKENQRTQIDKTGSLHNVRLNIRAVFTTSLPSRTKEHCEQVHSNKPTIAITIKQSAPTSRQCRGLFWCGAAEAWEEPRTSSAVKIISLTCTITNATSVVANRNSTRWLSLTRCSCESYGREIQISPLLGDDCLDEAACFIYR